MKTKLCTLNSIFLIFMIVCISIFSQANANLSDNTITMEIKSKIAMEKSLSVFNIGVTTSNGVVTLTGHVDSNKQGETLIQIAQSSSGVVDVDASKLEVTEYKDRNKNIFADTMITAKIKGLFIQKNLFSSNKDNITSMSIHVETRNGIVYLSGKADSQTQIDNAISIAKSVNGVNKIESTVLIEPIKR